jgi:hypothetical protein
MQDLTEALLERVQRQQESAARISHLVAACGGGPPAWGELEAVAADVGLKADLWRGLREWRGAAGALPAERLLEIDVDGVEDWVGNALARSGRTARPAGVGGGGRRARPWHACVALGSARLSCVRARRA